MIEERTDLATAPAERYTQRYVLSTLDIPYKLDEGYSEDTRSQDDGDSTMGQGVDVRGGVLDENTSVSIPPLAGFSDIIAALDERQRAEIAYTIIMSLQTSSVSLLVDRLRPLLYKDPVIKLPPDVTFEIFSYLSPETLLGAVSLVSRAWRERAFDGHLWRLKYKAEGWTLEEDEIAKYLRELSDNSLRKTLSRKADNQGEQRLRKRRHREVDSLLTSPHMDVEETAAQAMVDLHNAGEEHRSRKLSWSESLLQDLEMQDASPLRTGQYPGPADYSARENSNGKARAELSPYHNLWMKAKAAGSTSLVEMTGSGEPRMNNPELYKQKRRLEANWAACRFTNFQLPHQDYPEEAHTECVYTIQFSGNVLVSGSRDRTLRVWDLTTQRLMRKPLVGHTGSVLCLQFDPRPSADILISGSSDTSVIIWQFSTGEILHRIPHAHQESVLNLKFDDRYLVTCSKDKTIKVWNRNAIAPGHKDYPIKGVKFGGVCPAHIISTHLDDMGKIERILSDEEKQPLKEFSLLMAVSHGAAVNAVYVHDGELVSASGDRSIRVWDIRTGCISAVCTGHLKGIACVQYDGRRIVSGSSDDSIRVYDPISQAEVGNLRGHTKLVRTVQASFGDRHDSAKELEREAKQLDRAFYSALGAGLDLRERPIALGAKLPHGGGGNRWSKIVSGSYDETVIIWRKNGRQWVEAHKLKQADALRASGPPLVAQSELHHRAQVQAHVLHQAQTMNAQSVAMTHALHQQVLANNNTSNSNNNSNSFPATGPLLFHPLPQAAATSTGAGQTAPPPPPPVAATTLPTLTQLTQNQGSTHQQQQLSALQSHILQAQQHNVGAAAHVANVATLGTHNISTLGPHLTTFIPTRPQNARVFKLQFDSRRLISCSQDPKIVGWDFANGDDDIIAASRFFGPPT